MKYIHFTFIIFAGLMTVGLTYITITQLTRKSTQQFALTNQSGSPIILDFNTPTNSPTPSHTQTPTQKPSPTISPTPTSVPITVTAKQLDELFETYAKHYSVDKSLLLRIARRESGLKPDAVNWIYGGLFQFSPNTWSSNRTLMGMDSNPELRFSPEESIKTGAFVLSTRGPSAWPNCSK